MKQSIGIVKGDLDIQIVRAGRRGYSYGRFECMGCWDYVGFDRWRMVGYRFVHTLTSMVYLTSRLGVNIGASSQYISLLQSYACPVKHRYGGWIGGSRHGENTPL
jgi:hypothetical protein